MKNIITMAIVTAVPKIYIEEKSLLCSIIAHACLKYVFIIDYEFSSFSKSASILQPFS